MIAVSIVLIIAALVLIVTVLLQSSDESGISALSGQSSQSYFSKSKAKTLEAKLALGTKISAGVFVALSLLMLILKK
ncbi:MAG: preprotein translocase subunit SecG [Clostridiales bacterium]|nr:preprotein translocase subunit SecG [Clostridiales bacterium]